MTEFISTYSIDFDNLKISESIDKSNWDSLLFNNDGSFMTEHEITTNIDGLETHIGFTIYVNGSVFYDRGDYWTPPSSDVEINSVSIDIREVIIDEYEVELGKDLSFLLESKISKLLS
jgi:hypothetical protein